MCVFYFDFFFLFPFLLVDLQYCVSFNIQRVFFFRLYSIIGYYKILGIIPNATQ